MTRIMWFRRDLRLTDHPALLEAHRHGPVVPVFVIDPPLWQRAGSVRRAWLAASVQALNESLNGELVVRIGSPKTVLTELAQETGAAAVHVSRETTPVGARRDRLVASALGVLGIAWVETGTPYAVGPGLVTKGDGQPYKVFTPFSRAWAALGSPSPAPPLSTNAAWVSLPHSNRAVQALADAVAEPGVPALPPAGERAALRCWSEFLECRLGGYATARDRADLPGTSRLSPYLKVGAIHPRTLLAGLGGLRGEDADRFRLELAWRDFYADVLWRNPSSAWTDLVTTLDRLEYDDETTSEVACAIDAWRAGLTGFPIVDAGMRQLRRTGWMHNRVRMITASFLTKDLHVRWQVGARHFLDLLLDGDIASNNHGWQWVAGTGTDASPYVRVFNPVTQGQRFDPAGDYVRRWVPELTHLRGADVHEPWRHPQGYTAGYPERIVDHAAERAEALRRFAAARGQPSN
ncbi:MAG: deoxyribodipyrimidine photo-lyase [Phycicoccus sp.]|nr:deoxyribodipyrimidine photo-lyase [Phycicoccus sp.]